MRQPGELNQLVTLRAPQVTTDKFGQHTTWATVADVAARVNPLKGSEYFAAGSMQSPAEVEVEIHYRADVQSNWRVTWMSRVFEIVGAPIDVDARHATLLLMCKGVAT